MASTAVGIKRRADKGASAGAERLAESLDPAAMDAYYAEEERRQAAAPIPHDEIWAIVMKMQAHAGPKAERARKFGAAHPAFLDKYPRLFEMATADGMDTGMLRFIMERMREGEGEECERTVGLALAERYVGPLLKKTG